MLQEELDAYDLDSMVSREEDEDPTYIISEPILIDKTDSELSQTDRLIAEHGKMLVKSVHCGGIAPDPNREHSNPLVRMMKRMGHDLELPEHSATPLPSPADTRCDEFREEGDRNEEY